MSKERVKPKPSDYVHLHNHTQYSLLDGLTKVPALFEYVKELGMEAVAMTDHGTMSGVIEFYKTAHATELKPIIGMEAYIAPRRHTDKDVAKDRQYYHLTMLAQNNTGYQNLMRLSTIANLDGFYYKPRIDHELIEKYNEGIIVLSGCIGGEVSDALRQGQYEQAKKIAEWYKGIFQDRYYLELQDHGHPKHPTAWKEQNAVNEQLIKLSKELDIPAVVTCDAHYLKHEDQDAHEILLCVQTGSFLSDEQRMSLKEFELHVADPKGIIERWGDAHPELITNTKQIADRCDVKIDLGKILIPKFPTPHGETEKSLLEKYVWQGLAWRYSGKSREESEKLSIEKAKKLLSPELVQRAEFELSVVDSMGFNGYFLIVADFINWGKDRGIVFGPGRGSAAGSLMAYAMRITELDPMAYDLLFERFLNPDRISMPDMDIDIQDSRREEVINYCVEKYGRDRVANIVTFGKMAARNSVRDVARVLQVPYAEADRLAKMLPPPVQGRHIPLAKSLEEVSELKDEKESNQQSSRVFEMATKLEGTIRSHGVHAAGVVIAPDEIVKFVPLEMAQKGVVATQYPMGPIEDLGLLKMDFLGLSNLTIIKNALRIIKKVYGKDIDINLIPMDDKKTFELLQRGDTIGVFQLESSGMRRYLKQLKPTEFDDIIAMVALYRPGPMQFIDDFIARKHGQKEVKYDHPGMKAALGNTYGILVYQEQFMQISKDMCGFTGGQADTLRKAIGKKQRETMAKMKTAFIDGMVEHSQVSREYAAKFWKQLEAFADYCFNKSHSACYGLIAYQTAYLKAHYPAAFMAALMTSDYDNTDRLAIEITECKHLGIDVLPPDVNQSFHEFAVVPQKNQIRFGLDAIKNVGHGAAEEIIRAREELEGGFKTIEEYCQKVNPQFVNKKALESLIKAGAFDRFADRSQLINNMENILALSNRLQKDAKSGQVDLFGNAVESEVVSAQLNWDKGSPSISQSELLSWERDLLGLYLSHHPLEAYQDYLSENAFPISSMKAEDSGRKVRLGGSLTSVREITTKNGSKMAFARLEDTTGEIELVVFPSAYQKAPGAWQRDRIVVATGKLNSDTNNFSDGTELKLMVDSVQVITLEDVEGYRPTGKKLESLKPTKNASSKVNTPQISKPAVQRLYIRMEKSDNQPQLMNLKEKLDNYSGETEVVLVAGPTDSRQIIKLPQSISVSEESLREIADIFGSTNVVVR